MSVSTNEVVEFVKRQAASDAYGAICRNLLAELVEIDTSPRADLGALRSREAQTFAVIEAAVRDMLGDGAVIERRPIAERIEALGEYAKPYYARRADAPAGSVVPSLTRVYADRANLVVRVPAACASDRGQPVVFNAHIDTVAPWVRPRSDADRLFGAGACDAKGQVAALLGQIKLCEQVRERFGTTSGHERIYQFVIDKETGGNGTLSLCSEGLPAGAAAIVGAMTGNVPHPAGRGSVWFTARLDDAGRSEASVLQMFAFVAQSLEQARRRLADESAHALFEPHHVQTDLGKLGPYGTGPASVADHMAMLITIKASANPQRVLMHLTELLDATLIDYCARFGDLTTQRDPQTGEPRLASHYKLTPSPQADRLGFRLDVYGKGGHIGARAECDNALTKAAWMLQAMVRVSRSYPNIEGDVALIDAPAGPLVVEGAQGFLPPHGLAEVERRLAEAATAGAREYCAFANVPFDPAMVHMSFEKLRNDAYASDVDCAPMSAFRAAFEALGRPWPEPRGWPVTCDARLFGQRGVPTVTFGPGNLTDAGGPDEHIVIRDLQDAVALGTLACLHLTGALPGLRR